jgi:hypothetical protein
MRASINHHQNVSGEGVITFSGSVLNVWAFISHYELPLAKYEYQSIAKTFSGKHVAEWFEHV